MGPHCGDCLAHLTLLNNVSRSMRGHVGTFHHLTGDNMFPGKLPRIVGDTGSLGKEPSGDCHLRWQDLENVINRFTTDVHCTAQTELECKSIWHLQAPTPTNSK